MRLGRVDLRLQSEQELSVEKGSSFHGVLMELLRKDSIYVEQLHQSQLHPFTQHLERHLDGWHWIITMLNDEAIEHIWIKGLSTQSEYEIRHDHIHVSIVSSRFSDMTYEELIDTTKKREEANRIQLTFQTPTAFRSQGKYIFYPDARLLYQSLMNKFSAAFGSSLQADQVLLEEMTAGTTVTRYALKSVYFPIERVRIPSFVGTAVIQLDGEKETLEFIRMLLNYASYAGIGIKTTLGMGALRIRNVD